MSSNALLRDELIDTKKNVQFPFSFFFSKWSLRVPIYPADSGSCASDAMMLKCTTPDSEPRSNFGASGNKTLPLLGAGTGMKLDD